VVGIIAEEGKEYRIKIQILSQLMELLMRLLMKPLVELLMKPLAIPLCHQKTVAKRLVIAI
jgi:hypothetical protein